MQDGPPRPAAGLIGGYLIRTAARWAPQWDVRGMTRAEADLTDQAQVAKLVAEGRRELLPTVTFTGAVRLSANQPFVVGLTNSAVLLSSRPAVPPWSA